MMSAIFSRIRGIQALVATGFSRLTENGVKENSRGTQKNFFGKERRKCTCVSIALGASIRLMRVRRSSAATAGWPYRTAHIQNGPSATTVDSLHRFTV
jgi:hypothetical protein